MKKKILVFLILFITIIIPCSSFIYRNIVIKNSTQMYNLGVVGGIKKGVKLSQEIEIPGKLKKYGIRFGTYLRKNKGKIKISLVQGNQKVEEIIDVSTIKNDEITYLKMNFSKIKKGKAFLTIEGIDGEDDSSITPYVSSDISFGTLYKDGKNLNKGIIQYSEFYSFDGIIATQIIFLLLAIFSFFLLNKFLKEEKKNNLKIYFLVVLIIFFVINIKVPTFSFYSEAFAETATNFFANGLKGNIIKTFFIQDAGYWPLFQRVVSLFIVKFFGFLGPVSVIFLLQNTGILIISLIVSSFCLYRYKKYGDFWFRFLISMLLGTLRIGTYIDTHAFINFSYYGIVALILIALLDFKSISKKYFSLLIILTVLLNISKSHFIVLLPIVVFILIFFRNNLSKRDKIFLGTIGISNFFQILYMIRCMKIWDGNVDNRPLTFFERVNIAVHQVVQQVIFIFYPNTSSNNINLNMTFLLLLLLFIGFCVFLFFRKKNKENFLILMMIILTFGVSMFNVISRAWVYDAFWLDTVGAYSSRHSFFIIVFIIYISILLLYNLKNNNDSLDIKKYNKIIYLIVALFLFIRFSVFDMSFIIDYKECFSDWRIYSKFLKEDSYMIPVEPYPWTMSKNVRLYHIGSVLYNKPSINFPGFGETQIIEGTVKQLHEIKLTSPREVSYLYVKRLNQDNTQKLKMKLYDKTGKVVTELIQLNNARRLFVGFKNDKNKLDKIYKIEFFNQDGTIAYVQPEILIASPVK